MSIGVMLFCPFTGKPRHPSDIESDPKGILVWDGEEPLRAYTPPAQRKPLTDEQIDAEFDAFASKFDHESNEWLDMGVDAYFRAGFTAAHGIKENT